MLSPAPTIIDLEFAQIEIHTGIAIIVVAEGEVINKSETAKLFAIFTEHFGDRKFVYISDRKFDYTVDPTIYMQKEIHPSLLGIAIVCYSEATRQIALFEKEFYSGPFEICANLEEAFKIAKDYLKIYKEKAGL